MKGGASSPASKPSSPLHLFPNSLCSGLLILNFRDAESELIDVTQPGVPCSPPTVCHYRFSLKLHVSATIRESSGVHKPRNANAVHCLGLGP
jgi:hypothetical protein